MIISFLTTSGQKNQFSIDIVYALPTDIAKIRSTLDGSARQAASIENIICDKLSASHRFKSGNTRMKDFDDLWRILKSDISVNSNKLKNLLSKRKIPTELDIEWIPFLESSWKKHIRYYKDIPRSLENVFSEINNWVSDLEKK